MMDFWNLYVSGFWPWLGMTIGMVAITYMPMTAVALATAVIKGMRK